MQFEKDLKWSVYYDYYGSFLTEKQSLIFKLYYDEDLSLAEIAAEIGISRQGVLDSIKKSQQKLLGAEEKLELIKQTEDNNGI